MKTILAILVAFGLLFSTNAMAVHKCGQLLGSCIPHGIKTPVVKPPVVTPPLKPIKPKVVPARPVKK